MKKEMVKALSIGLSAATLAGSMDITAFAAEDVELVEGEANEVVQNQETTSAEQTVVEAVNDANVDMVGSEETTGVIATVEAVSEANPSVSENATEEATAQEKTDAQTATNEILEQSVNIPYAVEDGKLVENEEGMPVGLQGAAGYAAGLTESAGAYINRTETSVDEETGDEVYEQAGVVADVEAINEAADSIDTIDEDIEGTISDAETAATVSDTEVGKAETAVNTAVEAVNTESVEVAQVAVNDAAQSVEDAKAAYDAQKQNVEDCRAAYEAALIRRDEALQAYNTAKENALSDNGNLARAEQALAEANLNLEALEQALEVAKSEFEGTAAYILLNNENAENRDEAEYVKAIIENNLFEGKEVTVSGIEKEGTVVAFDVKNVDGKTIGRYTFSTDEDGVVSINALDLYEYTIKNADGSETTVVKTKDDMDSLVDAKKAVQRVTIKDADGNVTYKLYSALTAEEQAKVADGTYSCEYIILDNTDLTEDNFDSDASTSIDDPTVESVTKEGTAVGSFDANGNYILTVTDETTKKIYTYINGELEDVSDQKVNTVNGTNNEVKAAAEAKYAELLAAKIAEIKNNGFTGFDENGNSVTFTKDDIKNVGSESVLENPTIYWTVDGFYVPVYTDHGVVYCKEEISGSWLANLFHMDRAEERIAEKYQEEHPNIWVKGNANLFDGNAFKASISFVNSYDINLVNADGTLIHYNDRNAALEAVKRYAIAQNQQAYHEEFKWATWKRPYPHFENEYYNYTVSGIATTDGYDSKITTDSYYSFTQDARIQIETAQAGTQTRVYNTVTTLVSQAVKAGVAFKSNDETYLKLLKDTQAKVDSYSELLTDTQTAKTRVQTAQENLDNIRTQIENLNKSDVATNAAIVAAWEARLQAAEEKLAYAETKLNNSTDALATAKAELDKKIQAIEEAKKNQENADSQTTDETADTTTETTTTTSSSSSSRRYYPTTAPVEEVAENDVVMLDNPVVPLAGNTANTTNTAVRRNANNNNNVADADTVTVDETEVPLAVDEDAVEETEEKVDEVSIASEETPLAAAPQKNFFQKSWWWLLLLLIAVIGSGVAYAKKKSEDKKNTTK